VNPDPSSAASRPRADELAEFLRSLGASDAQIEAAACEGKLTGLAADLVLAEGASLTTTDVAERTGLTVDTVMGLWRLLGIAVDDSERRMFSERDVRFTADTAGLAPIGTHGDELARVLGSAMAGVAEAAVSLYVQTVEPDLNAPDVDPVVWAKDIAATAAGGLRIADSMGAVFIHHLQDAIARQRTAQASVTEKTLFRLAVGFVDLVGFTPISTHTAPTELLELIGRFEARAFEVASAHRGRIVKHIGDEVMFVALDAAAGCAIASELSAAVDREGIAPRGGVVFGEVISRHGDYYGPGVNLAARLADLAIPGEVLVDAATAATARSPSLHFEAAGRRLLKGFDQPVDVFSLSAHSTD
jgi:adenylate cyclase